MKILIVRLSSLGDVIHNMPMVADILRSYPYAQIDWVVEEAYADLIELNAGIRHVIPFALRRWRKQLGQRTTWQEISAFCRHLRNENYDYVFDTQGLLKSGVVMKMARLAPQGRRIGMANGTEGCAYESISRKFHDWSVPVPPRAHAVQRARFVAATCLGYPLQHEAEFCMVPPGIARPAWLPAQPYVVFFHATARPSKQWPTRSWIEVGKFLAQRKLPALHPWGNASERQHAETLAAHIPGAIVLPSLSTMEATLLANQASLVIGVDTGLTHVAAAYCRPTIELYCDSPRWNTEGNWSPNILNLGDIGHPPTVDAVSGAIEQLLNGEHSNGKDRTC